MIGRLSTCCHILLTNVREVGPLPDPVSVAARLLGIR
jgi:hypothetical protein